MTQLINKAKQRLPEAQVTVATRMGLSGVMAREVQREVLWWAYPRVLAARSRTARLWRGLGIGWTSAGYAALLPVEVPRAGRGMVTAIIDYSVVSPGTERARYLRLPNASFGLGMPGYSASGRVLEIGPGVTSIAVGDQVALAGASHATVASVPERHAYRLPRCLSLEQAALIRLGVISAHGVSCAAAEPGQSVCVIGAGLIGALAQRIALAQGLDARTMIARTRVNATVGEVGGVDRFLAIDESSDVVDRVEADIVIDATGDPSSVGLAIAAVRTGGRVVVLGSPRGATGAFALGEVQAKRLEIVGAHIEGLTVETERTGVDAERGLGEAFLRSVSEGSVPAGDLLGDPLDPEECAAFYRALANHSAPSRAYFDWTAIDSERRIGSGRMLRLPSLRAAGMDFQRRPLRPRKEFDDIIAGLDLDRPFREASGMLRIGLLGCGDIAGNNAAAAVIAPNTTLTACFDPVRRLAQDIAGRFDIDAARSADELFYRDDIDAVMIAVPHHLHAELAIGALASGKHVIVEKPLAHTLADALAIRDEAVRTGGVASVCFPYRYTPKVQIARRLADLGVLGTPSGAHLRVLTDQPPAYWVGGYSGRSPSTWRASREKAGGGVLIMNSTHYLDLLRYVAGMEFDEVWALADTLDAPVDVEDAITVSFRATNGAIGSMVGCSAIRGAINEELRIWGRDGHVAIEPDPRVYTLRSIVGLHTARWQTFGGGGALRGGANVRATYLSRFATAVDRGMSPDVSIDDAVAVQAFVEAAYRSSEEQCGIRPGELLKEVHA